jgi:hypothetical protein
VARQGYLGGCFSEVFANTGLISARVKKVKKSEKRRRKQRS